MKKFLLYVLILSQSQILFSQAKTESGNRYVIVDSTSPDAVILDGTDFFESKPLCKLSMNDEVTIEGSTDGEYIKIKAKCNGDLIEGWVKKLILSKEPMKVNAKVSESAGAKTNGIATKASIGIDPIDPSGINSNVEHISVKGTGRTTGHIANIKVKNRGDKAIEVKSQLFYIPSDGKYQSYVGRIKEGQVLPPGEAVQVPVIGYCTDVHKPPVANDAGMPAISSWIPIQINPNPNNDLVVLLSNTEIPPFSLGDIPTLINGDGFNPKPSLPSDPMIATWPGSDLHINGTFNTQEYPGDFAPVIIDAFVKIEKATNQLIDEEIIHTPFSANQSLESEAIIQQTFWVYLGLITGERYDKENFHNQMITQYENKSHIKIEDASDETVAKLESGVDDFWSSFELVGVEAKVISVQSDLASGVKDGMEKALGGTDKSGLKAASDGAAEGMGAGATAKGNKIVVDSTSSGVPVGNEGAHVGQGAAASGSSGAAGAGATAGTSAGNGTAEAADPGGKKEGGKYDGITKKEDLRGQMRQYYEDYERSRKQGASHDAACRKLRIKPDSEEAKALEKVFKTEMHIN
jgi:hypothetical protein